MIRYFSIFLNPKRSFLKNPGSKQKSPITLSFSETALYNEVLSHTLRSFLNQTKAVLLMLLSFIPSTSFTTILYIIPDFFPFFSPDKGAPAGGAILLWQVGLAALLGQLLLPQSGGRPKLVPGNAKALTHERRRTAPDPSV